jgi:DNA polymerase-1
MVVQGSAADLIKLAMLKLDRALATSGTASRLVLQIHDELLVECSISTQSATASLVRAAMRGALDEHGGLQVPLDVDVSAGPNWLDVEAITDDNA